MNEYEITDAERENLRLAYKRVLDDEAQAAELVWANNQLSALRERHDMMRNDIFSEIGRLMYHVENYKLDANTYKGYAARIAAYQRFLQLDEDRS